MKIRKKLGTAKQIFLEKGFSGIKNKINLKRRTRRAEKDFQKWIKRHEITEEKRLSIKKQISDLTVKPLISVIMPVYNTDEKWLRLCIESVLKQLYENWEFCIADDHSPQIHVRKILEEYAAKDERIKLAFRDTNGHISAASNSALSLANGEFCALLDHDDELTEDALFYVARELNDFPETAFIYTDEDMIDEQGNRFYPKFKPDFSRDLLYSLNLITHLSVYRTDVLRKIGGFRIGLEGSQDYDLALRFIERTGEKQIRHIPRILYHWRAIQGSVALSSDEKPYAHERARVALSEHFERTAKPAQVEQGIYYFHRVRYRLPENLPRVSLILTENNDVEEIAGQTVYENLEPVVITAEEANKLSKAECLNRAAARATGEILCFLGDNLRPLAQDWLKELASFAIQKEIGAVGGKILAPDETILDGGLICGFEDLTGAAFKNAPRETDENLYRARVINNFSAVSINCLMTKRAHFEKTGGFDAKNLPDSLFDANYCLKLRSQDLRIVFTPYAEFIHTGKSVFERQPTAGESEFFRAKWQTIIERDPFYNPNLSLAGETFKIEV